MKYICRMILTGTLLSVIASISIVQAEIVNADFSQLEETDNLWDGVNRTKQLQVNTRDMSILISGGYEEGKPFGACPRVGDIDGDGVEELVVSDAFGFIWVYKLGPAKKNRKVSPGTFYHTYFGDTPIISLYDWNNDKQLDLLVGNNLGTVSIVKNRGGGVLTEKDYTPSFLNHENDGYSAAAHFPVVKAGTDVIDIGNFAAPYIYDWDGDGRQDMLLGEGSYSANSVYLFLNTASKANPDFKNDRRNWLAYGMGREQLVPAVGDLDGDGDADLVVGDREGYVTFYRNDPQQKADTRERYLVPLEEEIKFDTETQPVGGMVRPELVDWDGDGDLDLLLGANDGRIYFAENSGTKKKYKFIKPVPLMAIEDKEKPYKRPTNWNIDHIWFSAESRFNSGAYMRQMGETRDDGTRDTFTRIEYANGYVGKIQRLLSSGRVPLSFGEEHEIIIECRGNNVNFLNIELQHYETAIKDDTTKKQEWPIVYFNIANDVKPEWKKIRKTFKISPELEENEGVLTHADKWLRMQFEGESDMTFDIKSVTLK